MDNQILYLGPSRVSDNVLELLCIIVTIVNYSDPLHQVKVICHENKVICYITPSKEDYKQEIIDNLLWINKNLHIKIIFSKSLKIQKNISFEIFV